MKTFQQFIDSESLSRQQEAKRVLALEAARHANGNTNTMFKTFSLSATGNTLHLEATTHKDAAVSEDFELDDLLQLAFIKLLRKLSNVGSITKVDEPLMRTDDNEFIHRLEVFKDKHHVDEIDDLIDIYKAEPDEAKREEIRKHASNYVGSVEYHDHHELHTRLQDLAVKKLVDWIDNVRTVDTRKRPLHTFSGDFMSGTNTDTLDPEDAQKLDLLAMLVGHDDSTDKTIDTLTKAVVDPTNASPETTQLLSKVLAMVDFHQSSTDGAKREFAVSSLRTLHGLTVSIEDEHGTTVSPNVSKDTPNTPEQDAPSTDTGSTTDGDTN